MISRVNLFGGPGVGKSTLAARLYACLKQGGIEAELVREDAKQWSYGIINPWDCVGVFGRQLDAEQRLLQLGIKPIITDSPLGLNCYYSQVFHKCPAHEELRSICMRFDERYPTLNFFVHRSTELFSNVILDRSIEDYISVLGIEYHDIMSGSESDFNQTLFRISEAP